MFLGRVGVALALFGLCTVGAFATVQNVLNYGAKGDGTTDDTTAIKRAIAALQPGDTLLLPCTTSNTYLISSQLTINVTDITVDGSSCAVIKDTYSNTGTPQGKIMVIGGNGTSIEATYGPAVALSATASELSTSFTTQTSLGVNPGDYVYICQGGTDGSAAVGQSCPPSAANGICDPDGCRGEVLKVASVSGNTVTATTALHDTYDPVANSAVAQKIQAPLTGITVKNMTLDGNGTNAYGLVLAGVAYSTVSCVTARNVQGAAVTGGGDFDVAWINITVTGAGSEDCGAAADFEQQGGLSVSGLAISQENTQQASGSGTCYINAGAFGFSLSGSADSRIANLSVDATGAYGRPFKTTAARWNTLNSITVQNGSQVNDNGVSVQYYSSHNTFNNCVVANNGTSRTGTGNAGVNLFGNYNQYDVFNGCTVAANGNIQFYDSYSDRLGLGTDSNNAIVGGTYKSGNIQFDDSYSDRLGLGTDSNDAIVGGTYKSNSPCANNPPAAYAVIVLEAPYDTVSGSSVCGPATYGIGMAGPRGGGYSAPGAPNACINNNVLVGGTGLTNGIYANPAVASTDVGSGNQTNSYSSNLTAGTCTEP